MWGLLRRRQTTLETIPGSEDETDSIGAPPVPPPRPRLSWPSTPPCPPRSELAPMGEPGTPAPPPRPRLSWGEVPPKPSSPDEPPGSPPAAPQPPGSLEVSRRVLPSESPSSEHPPDAPLESPQSPPKAAQSPSKAAQSPPKAAQSPSKAAQSPHRYKASGSPGPKVLYSRAATPPRPAIGGEWALKECEGHTDWVNELLRGRGLPLVTDLRRALADGVTLVHVSHLATHAQVLGAETREVSLGRVQTLVNLHTCLSHLATHGVDIAGIDAEDLADGNLKSTLLLVGNIRRTYDVHYGQRSEGDGGVSSDTYRENSVPQSAPNRQTAAPQSAMPGRLVGQGGQLRSPSAAATRDKPTPPARRVGGATGGGAMAGETVDGQEPRPHVASAATAYVTGEAAQGEDRRRYVASAPAPPYLHPTLHPHPSGHPLPAPHLHPTGHPHFTGVAHPPAAPRPHSARAEVGAGAPQPPPHSTAWGVGLPQPPSRSAQVEGHMTSSVSVEDRLRSLISSGDGKVQTVQYEDGELLVPPPPRPRDTDDQQRTSLAGYVPSRPVDRWSGSRAEVLMDRPRSQQAQPMVPPGNHDNQTFASDSGRAVMHRPQGSTLSMPGTVASGEVEGAEVVTLSAGQDLRSAWNKLFGPRGNERRPSLPPHPLPSQNPPSHPPQFEAPPPYHPPLPHFSQAPPHLPPHHAGPQAYLAPTAVPHQSQGPSPSPAPRPPISPPSAVRQVPLPPVSHSLQPQSSSQPSLISPSAMRPIPTPSGHSRPSSQERLFTTNESPQRASPMGQSSSTQGQLSGSTSSSYSGQNVTFSTFKPEEGEDDNEEEDREVQNVGALAPWAKYPDKSGSRPPSARGTPMSLRDTPVSHRQTPVSNRQTPVNHRQTPLSHRDTPLNSRETPVSHREIPSSLHHSHESLNGDVKPLKDHHGSWNELLGEKFNPMHTRPLSDSKESSGSGLLGPRAARGGQAGQGGTPYVNPAFEDSGGEESGRHHLDLQDSIFDYAVSSEPSSRSVTPPLPPLSPSQTPEGSARSSPEAGFPAQLEAARPDLLSSSKPPSGAARRQTGVVAPGAGMEGGRFVKKSPRSRTSQGLGAVLLPGRGFNSRLGGRASLSEPRETASESNLSFDVDTTTLLVEASDVDNPDPPQRPLHPQPLLAGGLPDPRGGLPSGEAASLRRQLAKLESLYHEVLEKLDTDRDQSGAAGAGFGQGAGLGQGPREGLGLVGGAPPLQRRWSLASSDTNSLRRGHRSRSSGHRVSAQAREVKAMQRRVQRVESHVVTLARSVAHLTSELRSHSALLHELDNLKREVRDLRVQQQRGVRMPGLPISDVSEFERFRGWIPSLTNPRRINKLTKFFGTEPPLLEMFLKKLGYERYAKNFENEHIGMIELPYMTEDRLQAIGIPMGPRLRILQEAQLCFRQENFDIYIV